ncbi:MAG: PAS domain S-box protein [FCB group bacterium]|nr:PAS domain S-box protein [FCB group bacterium]
MKVPIFTDEYLHPDPEGKQYRSYFSRHAVIFPVIAFILFAAVVILVWQYLGHESSRDLTFRTEVTVEQSAARLEEYINVHLNLVRFLRTHYRNHPFKSMQEFQEEVDDILAQYRGFQALNFINAEGIIQWVYPYKPNLLALGKDLHTHPMAAAYFRKAEKTGMDVSTDRLELYQGGVGFATYFPIKSNKQIVGYLNGVFRVQQFLSPLFLSSITPNFYYFLKDGKGQILLDNMDKNSVAYSSFQASRTLSVLDNTWELVMMPNAVYVARLQTTGHMLVLYFGLAAAIIFSWLYRLSLLRQRRIYETLDVIRNEEENYRQLIDNSPFGICVYREGRFIYINDAGLRLVGALSRRQFLDSKLEDIVHVDFRKGLVEKVTEMVNSPRHETPLEVKIVRFDHRVIDVELDASIIEYERTRATQIVVRNITDRKVAEAARQESEIKYKTLFESATDAIFVMKDDIFIDCNKTTLTMFGCRRKDILGESPIKFSPLIQYDGSSSKELALKKIKSAYAGKTEHFDWLHARLDGSLFDARVTLHKTIISGDEYLLATVRDMSVEKRVEKVSTVVYQISEAVVQTSDLQELYEAIHKHLGTVLETKNIYIALLDAEHNQLEFPYYIDEFDPKPDVQSLGNGLSEYVMGLRRPALVNRKDIARLQKEGKIEIKGTPPKVWLGAPLIAENQTIGIIAIQSYDDENVYDSSDLEVLNFVSDQIAIAIDRKRSERERMRQQIYFQQLFDNSPQGIIIVDQNDVIINVNKGFERIFQYTREEVLDRKLGYLIVPDRLREEGDRLAASVVRARVVGTESIRRRKDGSEFNVSILAFPVRFESEDPAIYAIYSDISDRVADQKQIQQSEQKFRKLANELAAMNDMKETLLDVISHDLKNPAGVIFGMTDMLLQDEPENEMLQLMRDSTVNLLGVIENATSLSRVAFGEDIHKEAMDFRVVIQDVVRDFTHEIENAGMDVDVDLSGDLTVNANLLLAEVIKNYVSNAVKYASQGKRIQVIGFRENSHVTVEVRDFGKTIPKAQIRSIFERGVQLATGKKRGRGLGLAIVKRIAEVHHGEAGVRPNTPHGNIFYLTVPV